MSDDLKDFICSDENQDIWAMTMCRLLTEKKPGHEPSIENAGPGGCQGGDARNEHTTFTP